MMKVGMSLCLFVAGIVLLCGVVSAADQKKDTAKKPATTDAKADAANKAVQAGADAGNSDSAEAKDTSNAASGVDGGSTAGTPKADAPKTLAHLSNLGCPGDLSTDGLSNVPEPAKTLCKHLIELKHRTDAPALVKQLDNVVDGVTVKALADNLLWIEKTKTEAEKPATEKVDEKTTDKGKQNSSKSKKNAAAAPTNKPAASTPRKAAQPTRPPASDPTEQNAQTSPPAAATASGAANLTPARHEDDLFRELRKLVDSLDQEQAPDRTTVVRLYNNRDAADIAKQLGANVKAIGDDRLIVPETSGIPQQIASLDLPRPEVTLNLWNLQLSAHKVEDIVAEEQLTRERLAQENERIHEAIERGWTALTAGIANAPAGADVFDPTFRDYISQRYLACASDGTRQWQSSTANRPDLCGTPELRQGWGACSTGKYCLGFTEAFIWSKPSLSRMIFLLAAMKDPKGMIDPVVTAMKFTSSPVASKDCPKGKFENLEPQQEEFLDFRVRLNEAFDSTRGGAMRAALADFLFNHKRSVQYPNQFIAYDLSHSADKLDSLFAPIVEGFDQDIEGHLSAVLHEMAECHPNKSVTFSDSGVVTVTATSSNKATVDITTANRFDTTPSFTISQYLTQLQKVESNLPQTALVSLHKDELAAFAALLSTQQPTATHIGRHFNLDITPSSLATASAVDLDISLDVGEDANSSGSQSGSSDDNPSRVASQKLTDRVRVETTRLFEVSSFSAALQREKGQFIVPILGEIPFFGPMFRFSRGTEGVYHHTLAVVHAVVVPTALDLAYGMRFDSDRQFIPAKAGPDAMADSGTGEVHYFRSAGDLPGQVITFHKRMLACWQDMQKPAKCPSDSGGLTFADVPDDRR